MSMEERARLLIQFARLGGDNLKVHNEEFGEICRDLKQLRSRRALIIISSFLSMNTSTLQECFFHAKLLIMFGDFHRLLQMSYGKNKLINRKIIRNKPFIKFISEIDVNTFVNTVCLKTSYINRMYMVRKISHLVEYPEKFFFQMRSAYGYESAKPFVPYCSMELVYTNLADNRITFNDKSLLYLHHKDPNFLKKYFKLTKDKLRKKLCIALCKDPVLLELDQDLIFGKRSFRHFYKLNKNYVLMNSHKFVKYAKVIVYNYGIEDYRNFLETMFPKYEDNFVMTKDIIQTLLSLRKKTRFNEFSKIYQKLYSKPYVSANEDLIMIITTEDRLKLDIGVRLEYLLPGESLQRFRTMNNISEETLKKMIICCKVNNCSDTLVEVMTSFSQYYLYKKNRFVTAFLKNLKMIPVENLGEKHWHYINLFLDNVSKFSLYDMPIFLHYFINYAIFLIRQGTSCEKLLTKILVYSTGSDDLRYFKEYPKVERYFLLVAPKIIDTITNEDIDELKLKYYYTLYLYNLENRTDRFPLYSFPNWFPNYLRKLCNPDIKCIYKVYHIIIELWEQDAVTLSYMDYREEVLAAYFNNMNCMLSENLLLWFLTNHPNVIEVFIDIIVSKTQPYLTYLNFYYQLNKMSWLGLANKLSKYCMMICNANNVILGRGIFQFLSFSSNFGTATKSFDPTICDLSMYNSKVLQECHRSLLFGGKNFIYPESAIPFMLNYCSKQYFKYFTPAFYNLIYNSPYEFVKNLLIEILKRRNDSPVWKQGIFLAHKMLNHTLFVYCMDDRLNIPPNYEVYNWVFKVAIKHLVENRQDSIMKIISKSNRYFDMDGVSELKRFKRVPTHLFCEFVQLIWKKNDQAEIIKYISSEAIASFTDDFNNRCLTVAFWTSNIDYIYNFCEASIENVQYVTVTRLKGGVLQKIVKRVVKERNLELARSLTRSLIQLTYTMRIQLVLLQRYMVYPEMFIEYLITYHESLYRDYGTKLMPSSRKVIRELVIELGMDQLSVAEGIMNYNYRLVRLKLLALEMLPKVTFTDLNFKSRLSRVIFLIRKESNEVILGMCNLYLSDLL